jgi:hypothetical protein
LDNSGFILPSQYTVLYIAKIIPWQDKCDTNICWLLPHILGVYSSLYLIFESVCCCCSFSVMAMIFVQLAANINHFQLRKSTDRYKMFQHKYRFNDVAKYVDFFQFLVISWNLWLYQHRINLVLKLSLCWHIVKFDIVKVYYSIRLCFV